MRFRPALVLILLGFCATCSIAQTSSISASIDLYLRPYVDSRNFSGAVLVQKNGKVVCKKAYGFADRELRHRNTIKTRFHIASMSMQFTAGAVLRLVDAGSVSLDEHVGAFVSGIEGANKITVHDLLTQRSGLPDINALPDYDDVLQHHQTPSSLVAKIAGKPLLFEPGSKFLQEEHSAYNLLALIVEKKSEVPFAAAVERLLFRPLGLKQSGVDDDSLAQAMNIAKGYEPDGTYELKPAKKIYWSGKTGNGSAYTTVGDVGRWVDALFNGRFLSPASRSPVLDTSTKVGYGWFRGNNKRFGETAYYMNGRAPGFASFVLYLPDSKLTVVVLSNIYSSATTTIGYDIAALSLGLPFERFDFGKPLVDPAKLKTCTGTFQFGPDFYQANAQVTLVAHDQELSLRWPSKDASALIPAGRDHFVDRSYWVEIKIERDASGKPAALIYDQFRGAASRPR